MKTRTLMLLFLAVAGTLAPQSGRTALQTEFNFMLPRGYIDSDGVLHREGTMRLATAADELQPLKDPRVQQNPAYAMVLILSRVVTRLGKVQTVNPGVIEGLYAADMSYLQEFYNRINGMGSKRQRALCPKCGHKFTVGLTAVEE